MIDTTYGEVRAAFAALTGLSRQGLQIPLAAALKWRRILGVLRPLVEQMEEQKAELIDQFTEKDADGKAVKGDQPDTVRLNDVEGFKKALQEMSETALQVGCDKVLPTDFGATDGIVSSSVVELLAELGPFFEDAEPAKADA